MFGRIRLGFGRYEVFDAKNRDSLERLGLNPFGLLRQQPPFFRRELNRPAGFSLHFLFQPQIILSQPGDLPPLQLFRPGGQPLLDPTKHG
jgi:hypothetical protein